MNKSRLAASPLLCALLVTGLVACSEAPPPAAAPPPPPLSQEVRTFSIGAMTAIAVRDGGLELPNDNQVFGVGRTPEDVAAVLGAAGLPTDKLSLSIQPLVVKVGGRVLLIDTGAGTGMGEGAGKLLKSLAEAGITPDSVTDILISHLHGDHVGGIIDAAGDPVFSNATVRISEPEWQTLRGLNERTAANFGLSRHTEIARAIAPALATFQPGGDVLPGIVRSVEVKGHTPGHHAFRIGSGSNTLLYVADSMHHHVVSVQKPDWRISFDADGATGAASRASLLADLAASGQRIYAVHFPFPGLGRIEKRDEGFAWVEE